MLTALFLLLALLSEVVGTIAGFGSSVLFVPLAGFFFGFHEVLALTSLLHVFSNAAKLVFFGRHIRWRLLFLLGIPSLIFVMVGALLSAKLEFKYTELILGAFLVGFSILFFVRPALRLSPRPSNSIVFGGAAGFFAGLIGTGGALRGLVLAAFDLEKNVFVATSAAIDTGVDLTRMSIYLAQGYLARESYWILPALLLVAFSGSYLGKILLNRIEQKHFRLVVLSFIFLIGLATLGRFLQQALR